ncbi:hypothetical protein GGI25_004732 [Coemansia spiralis]|uniref:PAS domain-containing protein n=2 Tax=Coemansia TaxID=4863 RepID=A0A9W8G486_9FUNG|nr:hypothetical protein EDC05_004504 [Coemansia umbellata]KAJ2620515.1 hypothetical protein GGI26_004922 [Coemansia sp. RSA 1358]KAJ2673397.1 hypothetical protein GGI25_004732 [Coemansia spiralis]
MSNLVVDSHLPQAFIGMHDKTPEMRVIYVSSNTLRVLGFSPSQILGVQSYTFIDDSQSDEYRMMFGPMEETEVTVYYTNIKRQNAPPIHCRMVHFNCDGIGINACFVLGQPVARGPWCLARRALGLRAFVLLGGAGVMGPKVVFASASFGRIIGIDSWETQGQDFLSLLLLSEVAMAADFLQRVAQSTEILLGRLRFARNPGVSDVEVIAAGSEDGIILVCQLGRDNLSLEEIISSDAETSDVDNRWGGVSE